MKSYLIVSGAIFALVAVGHMFELASAWHTDSRDYGFLWALVVIVLLSSALSIWAFRLIRAGRAAAD